MMVSSRRNTACGPCSVRTAMIVPSGTPMYSIGKTDAAARPSTFLLSPANVVSASDASTTNDDAITASSAIALASTVSPTRTDEVTPIEATTVAMPDATSGTGRPQAAASPAYSQNASSRKTSATAKKTGGGAVQTTATTSARSNAPLMTRVIRLRPLGFGRSGPRRIDAASLHAERDRRRVDAAVPPIAFLVRQDRFEEVAAAEIGPERFRDPDFGVRDLPEQEVAHAHLAARADEQVGIGLVRRIEELAEALLVEIVRGDARRQHAPRRVDDLGAPAVVQRDVEQHAAVLRGLLLADLELTLDVGRQFLRAADHAEPDVVRHQRAELETDVPLEQRHQHVDFRLGAL